MLDYSFTLKNLEFFILVLTRVTSFMFVAPFFSMTNTPRRIRVVLSVFITILLYGVIPNDPPVYGTLIEYAVIVLKEVVTGLILGFGTNLCMMVVNFAGHIADMETGLSMVTMFDPATRENVTITGVYYNYFIMLMMLVSGMHRYLIQALAETYTLIPLNGQIFHVERLLDSIIDFMAEYVIIGFRICLPIFATMILLNAILGILAKISPQLNMFAVGIQIKILVGLGILFLTGVMLPDAAEMVFTQMKQVMVSMVKAMS